MCILVIEDNRHTGREFAFLETQQDNATALHLFTSVGFHTVSAWQWMTKEIAPTE